LLSHDRALRGEGMALVVRLVCAVGWRLVLVLFGVVFAGVGR
jgi:hypothetical protein